jgi:hypothetical protein
MALSLRVAVSVYFLVFALLANAKPQRHNHHNHHQHGGIRHTCEFHGTCGQAGNSHHNHHHGGMQHSCEYHGTCGKPWLTPGFSHSCAFHGTCTTTTMRPLMATTKKQKLILPALGWSESSEELVSPDCVENTDYKINE